MSSATPRDNRFEARRTLRTGVVRVEARLLDFRFPEHSHDHLCLGRMRAGEYTSRYGLRRYAPRAGDVIFAGPGDVHDGRPAGRAGRRYTMLEIDAEAYRRLCVETLGREWLDFPQAVLRRPDVTGALDGWLDALMGTNPLAERDAAALLLGTVAGVERTDRPARRTSALAERVRRHLRERDVLHDAIGDLARQVGSSRYQLVRAFRDGVGVTPEDFRRQLRVQRARALLSGPDGLAAIAAQAGFADQSHMTREFRRLTGFTPGYYRRALQ